MKFPKIQAQLLFLGICMMLMNVGSRYIIDEFSQKEEDYKRNIFLRRVAIFAVCYMGTRDLVHALLLTAGFVVMAMGISRTHPNEGFETPPAKIGDLTSEYKDKKVSTFGVEPIKTASMGGFGKTNPNQ